jgi:transposase
MAQKRIEIASHLTAEELKQRYLAATEVKEARRWQVLWLVAIGCSTMEAAAVGGVSRATARRLVRRYNAGGAEGALDKRRSNAGRRPKLTPEQEQKLLNALQGPAPDGGLWTRPKVARWIETETGYTGGVSFGYKILKRVGGRLRYPRRHHEKAASEEEQEAWKQALQAKLDTRRAEADPEVEWELWAQDEARLGLKPILRRVWVVGKQRPLARTWHKYEWLYVVGFVHPESGRTHWLILPTINAELFSLALEEFAREAGVSEKKRVMLVLDGAGWHTANDVRVPEGIELVALPPYTPELQPAEHLWPLLNESIANQALSSLDELETHLCKRCRTLVANTQQIKASTNFHWWPKAA